MIYSSSLYSHSNLSLSLIQSFIIYRPGQRMVLMVRAGGILVLKAISILLYLSHEAAAENSDNGSGFSKLVAWMKRHGGRVDERLSVEQLDGVRGAVALYDIEEGAELLQVPWKLVIGREVIQDETADMCQVVRDIETELRLGRRSLWYEYLALDDSINSRLPALWDASVLEELQGLPPQEDATRHVRWFRRDCSRGQLDDDQVTQQALLCFITRADRVGMVPIYDLLNHHNGKRNAKLQSTEMGVELVALGPISAGEQIYLSYGRKPASTIFRDYGFVEPLPQIWTWTDSSSSDRHTFALFPDSVAAIYPDQSFLSEFWRTHAPLQQMQERAEQYTRELPTDALIQFQTAAKVLLESRPTSIEEDMLILEGMKKSLSQLLLVATRNSNSNEAKTTNMKDSISAVEYRISFKEALLKALDVSILLTQDLDLSSQEL